MINMFNCNLPDELKTYNYDVSHITLQETERLFKRADELGVLDEFAEVFWNAMQLVTQSKASLQECVNLLEEQKRKVGRQYDKMSTNTAAAALGRKNYVATKYNELEYQIRWLVDTFELTRSSKPYLLELK